MVLYHILRSDSRTFRNLASQSRRRRVYQQCVALYITNTKCCISSSRRQIARWRVMRYKGGSPPLMIYTARCAAMICQAYGNPQSSASSLRRTPTAAWIKKFRERVLGIFWWRQLGSNQRPHACQACTLTN